MPSPSCAGLSCVDANAVSEPCPSWTAAALSELPPNFAKVLSLSLKALQYVAAAAEAACPSRCCARAVADASPEAAVGVVRVQAATHAAVQFKFKARALRGMLLGQATQAIRELVPDPDSERLDVAFRVPLSGTFLALKIHFTWEPVRSYHHLSSCSAPHS